MRKIRYIVIHHSLTKDGKTLSWPAIRRYHKNEKKWSDIGYHIGVERYGTTYEVLVGRPWTQRGAHAPGRNHDSLGICLVGDFSKAKPPAAQWHATFRLVRWLMDIYRIPAARVLGHREVTKGRSCPGVFDMDRFREALTRA